MGRLPESWIAPPDVREVREEVRFRHKMCRLRTGLKSQVHQVLGKEGVIPELGVIWGPQGQRWLDDLELGDAYTNRVEVLGDLVAVFDTQIEQSDARIHRLLRDDPGYRTIQHIGGVGHVLAAVFVAEIGDVHRFASADRLCSWAGLTPRLRESDTHSNSGHITKQGSRLVRWAAVEAISGGHCEGRLRTVKARVGARRGVHIGRVAAARHLLSLVYYGMRDGDIRCLHPNVDAA